MKNILLPTDFSENSKNAITYALKFFEGETCTFYILNTQKSSGYITAQVLHGALETSIYDGVLNDNKRKLEKIVAFCKSISLNEDFTFIPKIDFDNIIDAVNQAVRLNNIELIVMGTNGATGAAEVMFGSNTIKVIRNVDCPVLAIPEKYTFQKIASVLLSFKYHFNVSFKGLEMLMLYLRKHKATLKILKIEEETIEESTPKNDFNTMFKDIKFKIYCLKGIPSHIAINAFQQLIPVQLHAIYVARKSFLDRVIFGSDTLNISYDTRVPLLVFPE